MTRRPPADEGRLVEAGHIARRVAVLLRGGSQPATVWRVLEDDSHVGQLASYVVAAQTRGESVPRALSECGHNALAAAWEVAETLGSPIAEALSRLADHTEAMLAARRNRVAAFAGPKATTRLITLLPLVALGLSFALGFNPLTALVGSAAGWVFLTAGLVLMWAGRRWSQRLLRRSEGAHESPGYTHELMAIALTGGFSVSRARLCATSALDRYPVDGASLSDFTNKGGRITNTIGLAERAGVSLTELLRAEADVLRAESQASAQTRAAKLAVSLLLPLGVCVLPAFILLGVLPMMLTLFSENMLSG